VVIILQRNIAKHNFHSRCLAQSEKMNQHHLVNILENLEGQTQEIAKSVTHVQEAPESAYFILAFQRCYDTWREWLTIT